MCETKTECSLAPPGGKISNQLIRIMIVLDLMNNLAAIFLSSQNPTICAKQKLIAHTFCNMFFFCAFDPPYILVHHILVWNPKQTEDYFTCFPNFVVHCVREEEERNNFHIYLYIFFSSFISDSTIHS